MTATQVMKGVRVLEVAEHTFVPAASALLADWGAEVIKIEPTERGDAMRGLAATGVMNIGGDVHPLLQHSNRGKRSLALDLSTPDGLGILYQLAETADVFLTNKLPHVRKKLKIELEDVRAHNRNIIYVAGTGQGERGPDADKGSYDSLSFWFRPGVSIGVKPADSDHLPGPPGPGFGDSIGAMTIAGGIMGALFHRERTGEGQEVEVAMFETMASFMLVEHANGALFSPALGPAAYPRVVTPNRRPYRTRDGYLSALVYNDKQWVAFVAAVKPPWAGEHLATLEQRIPQLDAVYARLAETFAERTTQEWLDLLRPLGIPAAPVRTLDELFDNPHLNQAGFFQTVDSPNGPVRFPGPPAWFSKTPGRIAGPAPRLGEHTAEIMDEIQASSDGEAADGH